MAPSLDASAAAAEGTAEAEADAANAAGAWVKPQNGEITQMIHDPWCWYMNHKTGSFIYGVSMWVITGVYESLDRNPINK